MSLQGERVQLRPLTRADLDEIEAWTPFSEPPDQEWNRFPWRRLGKDLWHELQSADPAIERYAVVDAPGRVIGVVGLIDTDDSHSPMLSIFLGSDFVGQGLGSDALRAVLRHAFQDRRLHAVRLDVAATNWRARRAYEKCGFRVVGRRYRPVEVGQSLAFLDDARYRDQRPFYRQEAGRTYVLYLQMALSVEVWQTLERRRSYPPLCG